MDLITIVDTETSTLDPATGELLEIAWAIWSIKHGALVHATSRLVDGVGNAAEAVNGIPSSMLFRGDARGDAVRKFWSDAHETEAIVAHGAEFDRSWIVDGDPGDPNEVPWVCSCDDIAWPRPSTSRSLIAIALAHGVGVVSAHRALADVMTLAHLFSRVHEMGEDVEAMLVRGLRPKAIFEVANKRFDEVRNALAKENGFRWDAVARAWRRRMAIEDAGALPFEVVPGR